MLPRMLILALDHPATTAAAAGDALTPLAPAWITGFLLLILWLFVFGIILGPLIRHFRLEPRSLQFFTGDHPSTGPRRL